MLASPDLGLGEKEVLALASEVVAPLVILDDSKARHFARQSGIVHTGTLGILLKAKKSGLLDRVTPVLDRLEVLRFRLDLQTRAYVKQLAGES